MRATAFAPPKAAPVLEVGDLDLSSDAKAAAESLVQQFGAKVIFTSGRRDIPQQAVAMATLGSVHESVLSAAKTRKTSNSTVSN